MDDIGFSGTASRFANRFEAGSDLTAKQLNNVLSGIESSLPRPYLGDGVSVSFMPGGSIITPLASTPTREFKQFECFVYKQPKEDDPTKFKYFVKVRRGVVNFNFSQFPWIRTTSGAGDSLRQNTFKKEYIIKDYGLYPTSSRTAGTDTLSDWMANDGKIEIKNAADGGFDTWVVGISKIDYYDAESWYPDGRLLVTAESPFVSVYSPDDEGGGPLNNAAFVVEHAASPSRALVTWYMPPTDAEAGLPSIQFIPENIGYDFKKIAQLDWNSVTKEWDLTQYLTGPIYLDIPFIPWMEYVNDSWGGELTQFQTFRVDHFTPMGGPYNSEWFERLTGSISGYTINPVSWWYPVVGA